MMEKKIHPDHDLSILRYPSSQSTNDIISLNFVCSWHALAPTATRLTLFLVFKTELSIPKH